MKLDIWTEPENDDEQPTLIVTADVDDDGISIRLPNGQLVYSADWHTHILSCFQMNWPRQ